MKIKEGKFYRSRSGNTYGPMVEREESTNYPFTDHSQGKCCPSWTEEGAIIDPRHQHGEDLIAEVTLQANIEDQSSGAYDALRAVLDEAFNQSAHGKGKERHANDLPFEQQPILQVARTVGAGFPSGQAIKKIGEAMGMANRGETDRAVHELLGAIVYTAATIIYLREQQK